MPNHDPYRSLYESIIFATEGGEKHAHILSHAEKGNSGFSIGRTQMDLRQNPDARAKVVDHLKQSGKFSDADLKTIDDKLANGRKLSDMPKDLRDKVDTTLGSLSGQALAKGLDSAQIDKVGAYVTGAVEAARSNPRYGKDAAFTAYVNGPVFRADVADNVNQFGDPKQMREFLKGGEAKFADTPGGDPVASDILKADETLDSARLARFESNYKYARATEGGAADLLRRHEARADALERSGLITPKEADALKSDARGIFGQEPAAPETPSAPSSDGSDAPGGAPGDAPGDEPDDESSDEPSDGSSDGQPEGDAAPQDFKAGDGMPTSQHDPRVAWMIHTLQQPGDPADEAMMKRPEIWTEEDARTVMKARISLSTSDPAHARYADAERRHFAARYGTVR